MSAKIKNCLQQLSFRTGVVVLLICVLFYLLSFAQMLLPVSNMTKGILWIVFFGIAKTLQYTGLTIIGIKGLRRIKTFFKHRSSSKNS